MDKLSGIIIDDMKVAEDELDLMVEESILVLRLKGQDQLYAFDLSKNKNLRNIIISSLSDEDIELNS
jgi:phosphoribosylaminoimidazole carboxylase (NCAIR synthetase)